MGLGFVTGVGWFIPKFSPVRNGGQAISDKSLEGIKREHFLHSGAENIILPKNTRNPETLAPPAPRETRYWVHRRRLMMRVPRDVSKRGTSVADRGPVKLGNPVSLMHCVMHPKFNDKTSYAPAEASDSERARK